jgi:hypothetical protein
MKMSSLVLEVILVTAVALEIARKAFQKYSHRQIHATFG